MPGEYFSPSLSRRRFLAGSALLAAGALAGSLNPLSLRGLRQGAEQALADAPLPPNPGTALWRGRDLCLWSIDCRSFRFELFESLVREIIHSARQSRIYSRLPHAILLVRDHGRLTEKSALPAVDALNLLHEFGFPALGCRLRAGEFDEAFAITGSANINERSMWHDSETAISFRDAENTLVVSDMLKALLNICLNGKMPKDWSGEGIYSYIEKALRTNADIYNEGKPLGNLNIRLLPLKPVSRPLGFFAGT